LGKLGPVIGHLGVIRDESLSDGDCDHKRGNTFRGREHVDEGVFLRRRLGDSVAETTPQIDDFDAIAVNGHSRSHFLAANHVAAKDVANLPVPLVDVPAEEIRRHFNLESHY
jgi:hypothetical protein